MRCVLMIVVTLAISAEAWAEEEQLRVRPDPLYSSQ